MCDVNMFILLYFRKSQDTQKLHLEVEGDEEKRDPENDTKEGRGSPKESVPALLIPINTPHGGTPTNTGSFTPRKLVQSGVHSPQWPPKGDLTTSQTPRIHPNIGVEEVHTYGVFLSFCHSFLALPSFSQVV